MGIKVKAKELGFSGGVLREPGTEFEIESLNQRGRWMEFKNQRDEAAWKKWKDGEPAPSISAFVSAPPPHVPEADEDGQD